MTKINLLHFVIRCLPAAAAPAACALACIAPASAVARAPGREPALIYDALLGQEIRSLSNADQDFLLRLADAKSDPIFLKAYADAEAKYAQTTHLKNFISVAAYEQWSKSPTAPLLVRRYVEFRHQTSARLEEIIATSGWPRRAEVGDVAAADVFFLFGHADEANAWRLAQLGALEKVFRSDRVNPRLFAHLTDRVRSMAGQPQLFGTIMGPTGRDVSGVYWPIEGTPADVDRRRAAVGLPSFEDDLAAFRQGADIGPYMSPLAKGEDLPISDAYAPARAYRVKSP